MRNTRSATRRNALEKLATLSALTTDEPNKSEDLGRLCTLSSQKATSGTRQDVFGKATETASIPMSLRELEVLLALCKAAPLLQRLDDAEQLLQRLLPYVPEAHRQSLKATSFMMRLPPWETLAYDLTSAVLSIALKHPSLRGRVLESIDRTVDELTRSAERAAWLMPQIEGLADQDQAQQALPAIQLTVSLLGFLNAASRYVQVWDAEARVGIFERVKYILSEKFMVSLEGALSALRNAHGSIKPVREWKRWARHYAASGQPLGAMLLQRSFANLIECSVIESLSPHEPLLPDELLDRLLMRKQMIDGTSIQLTDSTLESLTEIVAGQIGLLEEDADYLQVSSAWQQRLALEVKASSLRSFLCCTLINEEIADDEVLMAWLESISADPVQMAEDTLARTVLKSMTVLARTSPATASNLSRSLPRLIVQGKMPAKTAIMAGECLAQVVKLQSQDVVISTLYSLGNVLSASTAEAAAGASMFFDGASNNSLTAGPYDSQHVLGSAISLVISDEEESAAVYSAVVKAIVAIAVTHDDDKMTALTISMLVQKIGRINQVVDASIINGSSVLGLAGGPKELEALLRLYARVAFAANAQSHPLLISAVMEARIRLARSTKKNSPFHEIYLKDLLSIIVASGDTAGERVVDVTLATKTIAQIFRPLAVLVSADLEHQPEYEDEENLRHLARDAWFNITVHGFTLKSMSSKEHLADLQTLAQYSLPLIDEKRVDMPESGIELNTVLRRGANAQHAMEQKSALTSTIPAHESDIKSLTYPECVYLNTALLVSTLRASAGDCTAILPYFMENKIKAPNMGGCMNAIALHAVDTYLQLSLSGRQQSFAAPQVALQLVSFFEGCCHRRYKVQQAASAAADRIMATLPSALGQKSSLFALLELLTLMWRSCIDAETDEYDLKSMYTSARGKVSVQLSDDVVYRQNTLASLHKYARVWVSKAITVAPLDTKGLLQAYLEDYEDDGAYGHISLGRSFAVEMGLAIPSSDQRLMAIERQRDVGINTASDFMAQYTTRQEYRHFDGKLIDLDDWTLVERDGASRPLLTASGAETPNELDELRRLSARLARHEHVAYSEVRQTLRNAAGVLSQSTSEQTALVHDLVHIPFTIFTKRSIKLGISLWLGVVKENPSLESRVLVEVASGWEASVRHGKGFFHHTFTHLDPFYVKEEFAPSHWDIIQKRQSVIHDLLAPHLRLTQFLSSHFNASRLTSLSVERIYARLMRITMLAMKRTVTQPLAREVHFHIILLALQVLQYGTRSSTAAQWRLKDAIVSAGLSWFATSPRFSYGSNKLQLKAEVKLLEDVSSALQRLAAIGVRVSGSLDGLKPKQDLLLLLISQEAGRLGVWINPLGTDSRGLAAISQQGLAVRDTEFLPFLKVAWMENPSIAVQLATRFPRSQTLAGAIRTLLLSQPELAIKEPDALYLLFGSSLPNDVKSQLKYLLYWAPLNPMAAVTYFLPAYGNHPSIIQYGVRALESHSVDVTFFYVPQIVQALRYDALGYVERYIIETAKFSQLFAHQIIWNMKANAFKDEDSQEPDPVKPTLDKVMNAMISSWSIEDRDFYEREFEFFGKVTGISGILKPFIKRPKPEKKQKIEEELRKIQVEVGVYLPSNPDGVIIGIDRKSGKPLQSHAKAPFMATFRIRKEVEDLDVKENQAVEEAETAQRQSYEVWQSAIFKVGDDCRQDVLALQMIAAFRGIFNNVGLDVYVFPYRVTATAPGCGVIDVLPNSISRDMLGREAVNGLYEYFVSKYGYEDSIRFQEARSNFVKSMAAYSIISYLLQFKDRHNGNIMVDDAGHILHIDFGFCFDIAPGGVKFERAPFKLTPEMVAVMGGSTQSQSFRQFEELCVKVFLAARQYVEQLSHIVLTMLDSGLPCFKPQTIQHFKERFVLDKSDREAADFVRKLVHVSERSYSTGVYDYFQLLTNGIPY